MLPYLTFHIAAMPFPTYQGTQAVIHQMLYALAKLNAEPHLLTYGAGEYSYDYPYTLHRIRNIPVQRSFRSGPSFSKILLDFQLFVRLTSIRKSFFPRIIVAHHVEAAAATLMSRCRPMVFFAHTNLSAELPGYTSSIPSCLLEYGGRGVDQWISNRADAVATICPDLKEYFIRLMAGGSKSDLSETLPEVHYIPVPWPLFIPITIKERAVARADLGFHKNAKVVLYAGNLDHYQGWEVVIRAVRIAREEVPNIYLLVATQSDPFILWTEARKAGVIDRIRVTPLDGESIRKTVHAVSDLVVVPRRSEGGLPIKMLDAFARGIPVLVVRKAAAGLPLNRVAYIVERSESDAIASGMVDILRNENLQRQLRVQGPAYIREYHNQNRFIESFSRVCEHASTYKNALHSKA